MQKASRRGNDRVRGQDGKMKALVIGSVEWCGITSHVSDLIRCPKDSGFAQSV